MKTWKMRKGKSRENTNKLCCSWKSSEKIQAVFSETEREKSKTRVNGNCSKIIECMSKRWCVPASNKYTACKNKLVGHREELLKANKGSKEHLQVGCRAAGLGEQGTRDDRLGGNW